MTKNDRIKNTSEIQQKDQRTKRRKRSKPLPTKLYIWPSLTPTPKMREFMELVQPFEAMTTPSKDVYSPIFAYLHEEANHLSIMLKIEEKTTVQDLRNVIPLALAMRDQLLEFQGPRATGGDTLFYENLWLFKENGESWSDLTNNINSNIASYLSDWHKYFIEYKKASPNFKTWRDFDSWNAKQEHYFDLDHAKDLLRLMKLPDPEIEKICKEALDNIEQGKPAFQKGYPIDVDELRTTLRSWKTGKIHRFYEARQQREIAKIKANRVSQHQEQIDMVKTRVFLPYS